MVSWSTASPSCPRDLKPSLPSCLLSACPRYSISWHGSSHSDRTHQRDLAVLLGIFVPLVSLPMAALLCVAIFTVHLPNGFSSIKLMTVTSGRPQFGPPGYEVNLLYLACLAALVLGGCGPMAIDNYLRKKR